MSRPTANAALPLAAVLLFAGAAAAAQTPLADLAFTPNQFGAATAIEEYDRGSPTCDCDLSRSYRTLVGLPADDVRQSLSSLSGESLLGAFRPRQMLSTVLTDRLAYQLRPAGPEQPRQLIEYYDAPFTDPATASGPTGRGPIVGDPAADPACGPCGAGGGGYRRAYLTPRRPVTYAQGFGGGSSFGGGPGLSGPFGGVLVGGHLPIGERFAAGAAFQWAETSLDGTNLGADVRTARLLGYGRYVGDVVYAFGGGGYGFDSYDTTRAVVVGPRTGTASGGADGNEAFGFAETGLTLPVSDVFLAQPYLGFVGGRFRRDGFTETGVGDLSLNVAEARAASVQTYLGGRLVAQRPVAFDLVLRPELRSAWWHQYAGGPAAGTVSFVGAPGLPFGIGGPGFARNFGQVGTGATLLAHRTCSFGVYYDAFLGGGFTTHVVSGAVTCLW